MIPKISIRYCYRPTQRMLKTPLIQMIALVVMTSLFHESWCLIGLIGAPPHSSAYHHPRGLLMSWPTPRPVSLSDHKSDIEVTSTPLHRSLLNIFRCQTRALKSLIKNRSRLGDVESWIRFCSQDPTDVILSDCRQAVQTCTMTSASELLSVPGCFPVSRMLNCLGKTMTSCFRSPRAAMSVFRHLQSVCIRHRHDVTPKIN